MSWSRRSAPCFEIGKIAHVQSDRRTASSINRVSRAFDRSRQSLTRDILLPLFCVRPHPLRRSRAEMTAAPVNAASPMSIARRARDSRCHPSPSSGGLRRSWTRRTRCGPSAAPPSPNSTPSPNPSSSTCSATPPRIRRGGQCEHWTSSVLNCVVRDIESSPQRSGDQRCEFPNVIGGSIDLSDLKLVPVTDEEFERLRVRDGDFLFVRTNGNPDFVGRCALFDSVRSCLLGLEVHQFIYASYLIRARSRTMKLNQCSCVIPTGSAEGRRRLRARCKTQPANTTSTRRALAQLPFRCPPTSCSTSLPSASRPSNELSAVHRTAIG